MNPRETKWGLHVEVHEPGTILRNIDHFNIDNPENTSLIECYADESNTYCWNLHYGLKPDGTIQITYLCIGIIELLDEPHPTYEL